MFKIENSESVHKHLFQSPDASGFCNGEESDRSDSLATHP